MAAYVTFEEVPSVGRKTKIWAVKNAHSGFQVGEVKYYPNWRKFVFFPSSNCIFDITCLQEVVSFIQTVTANRNAEILAEKGVKDGSIR